MRIRRIRLQRRVLPHIHLVHAVLAQLGRQAFHARPAQQNGAYLLAPQRIR